MKLLRSRFVLALCCSLLFAGAFLRFSRTAAQNEPEAAREQVVSLQVSANDEIAAQYVAGHHIPLNPIRSSKAAHAQFEDPEIELGGRAAGSRAPSAETAASSVSTVPGVPWPGFYPADLSDPGHGKVLASVQSNNVYVNCAA